MNEYLLLQLVEERLHMTIPEMLPGTDLALPK
jgi:hypothetical protein